MRNAPLPLPLSRRGSEAPHRVIRSRAFASTTLADSSPPHELRRVLVRRVQETIAADRLGVEVVDARIASLAPPEEVKPAFDNVALQQTRIATRRHQSEKDAEASLRRAEAEKYPIEQTAAAYSHGQKLLARRDAERFLERLRQYRIGVRKNPHYLRQIWEEERGKLFARLKENNQIDLLDHHLGPDGLGQPAERFSSGARSPTGASVLGRRLYRGTQA
jgi:regulator of protease activity HflC (stomatin/prohibitin superfamily)